MSGIGQHSELIYERKQVLRKRTSPSLRLEGGGILCGGKSM